MSASLVAALSLCALTTHAGYALAAFSQVTCPASYSTTVAFRLSGYEFDLKEDSFANYQDSQQAGWVDILANSNVTRVWPNLGYFWTETNNDYFEFNDYSGYPKYTGYLNPTNSPMQALTPLLTIPHYGYTDIWYRWKTNGATNFSPPLIDTALVYCGTTSTTAINGRNLGTGNISTEVLLIGTGDTVYATFTQPANSQGLVILTHKSGGGDADLYLSSTNSTPDDASYTYKSLVIGDDAVSLPYTSTTKTWYVGVHSYNGSAHVKLEAKYQNPAAASVAMRVCTDFNPSDPQKMQIRMFLRSSALRMLSATDGGMKLGPFEVYPLSSNDCAIDDRHCGICLSQASRWAANAFPVNGCTSSDAMFTQPIWQDNWNLFAVHELGHGCFALGDEYGQYDWGSGVETKRLCGHSQMNGSCGIRNNVANAGFCSRRHCYDGNYSDADLCPVSTKSNWQIMKEQTTIPLTFARDWAGSGTDPQRTNYLNNSALSGLISVNFH